MAEASFALAARAAGTVVAAPRPPRASKGNENGPSTWHPRNFPGRRRGAGGRDRRAFCLGADQCYAHDAGAKDAGEAGRAGRSPSCRKRRVKPEVAASGQEAGQTGRTGGSERFGPPALIG